MARIQISHLTFAHEGSPDLIFDDASFQIDTDWNILNTVRLQKALEGRYRMLHARVDDNTEQLDLFLFDVIRQQTKRYRIVTVGPPIRADDKPSFHALSFVEMFCQNVGK